MLFRGHLLILTMTGILLVATIPLAVTGLRRGQLHNEMMEELNTLGRSECAKVAKNVYLMLRAQHEKLKKEVQYGLNVAEYVMNERGGLSLSQDRVHWTAQNQSSGQSTEIDLPKVLIGDRWIEQNTNPAALSPVVDKVRELVGARCTIFQRMNESGDLLRACTNVLKKDGTRAIGTYIPATEPDGTANPVVAAVLRGETYVGRAYVVDDWYLTAYKPIFDAKRNVVGALFCGVRLEDLPELRRGIVDITVGRTGYAYVLGGSGDQKGRYIISRHGLRDGENIYDSQDASGGYFIRSIIEKAKQTKNGDCEFTTYAWRNPGEESPRLKVAAVTYFEPWDWVIGVGTYEDDFQEAIARVDQAASRLIFWGSVGTFIAFMLCGMLAWVESGRLAAMNHEIAERKLAQARQGRMLQRLESLNQLQKDLLLPGSLADKLKKITDAAVELFELDFCRTWHIEPGDLCSFGCIHATAAEHRHICPRQDVCLHLMASSGRYSHVDGDHRRVPLGCYKIGLIATGQDNKFLTNDVTTDPRVHNHEWAANLGLVSFAGYKLRDMHGDPIGVLAVFAKHALSEEEDAFLSNLAETTSGVIVESEAEESIRTSEAKYKAIYNASGDAIMYVSPDNELLAGNAAAIRLFGCKDEKELVTLGIAGTSPEYQPDGTPTSEKARQLMAVALKEGSNSFEWQHRRMDGSEFLAAVSLTRMELEGQTVSLATVRDITAQKEAERAQHESERRLASIIDFLPDATFAVDRDGKVIAWNRAIEEMTGVPAAQMLGQGDHAYAIPFYGERRPVLVDLIFEGNEEIERHYHSIRRKGMQLIAESVSTRLPGGKDRHIWIVAAPLYDSAGQLIGGIESIRDITEQRRAEDALRASETKYRTVYDASLDGILVRTPDRKIVAANRAAIAMFGCKEESELINMPLAQLYPERQPDGSLSSEKAKRMLEIAAREGKHLFEWSYSRKDGTPFYATVALTAMNLGGQGFHLTTIRDITEQRQAEEALRASERSYRLLAENIRDIIWTLDFSGNYTYMSPSGEQMLGIKWEPGMKLTAIETLAPGSRQYAFELLGQLAAAAEQGQSIQLTAELELLRKDGSTVWVEVTGGGMRNETGQIVGVLGVSRDITERKQYELKLAQARDEAQAANRAKSAFLASMSHELRTPLNAVLGFSQLMRTDPTLSESQRENLDIINRSGVHLLGLINDVLEISRIEAGRVTKDETDFDLWNTLETIKDMMSVRAKAKGLPFILERGPSLPRYVRADERKLKQVLINLAGNAVKFTQQGEITLKAKADNSGRILRFEVEDTGPGIDTKAISALFESFVQGNHDQEGAGLGLFISRKLVEFMGGQIAVQSEMNQGSVFSFYIPCESVTAAEIAPPKAHRVASLAPGQTPPRILVTEDKPENRLLMTKTLRSKGFEVVEAVTGIEAVQLFELHQPDLVLMDMRMPVMDGYEAIKRIRSTEQGKTTPIIAVTASAFEEDRQKILALGADDFIRKPVQDVELFEKIRLLLGIAYIYAEVQAQDTEAIAQTVLVKMVAQLPNDLTDELTRAMTTLDLDKFKALLPTVAQHTPILAEHLGGLADALRVTELAKVFPTTIVQ